MSRIGLREKAVALRLQEQSYSQIKEAIGVPKSTLHYWLKDYPLSRERINQLRGFSEKRIERCRATKQKNKEARLLLVSKEVGKMIFPFSRRDLFVAGYALYWGEGLKAGSAEVSIANTDPAVISCFIRWLEECFGLNRESMRVRIHYYSDMDVNKENKFWSEVTGIGVEKFSKPYIKESKRSEITYRGMHGHGTCNIRVYGVGLRDKVIEGIKLLQKEFRHA